LLHDEVDQLVLSIHQQHPSYGYRSIQADILHSTGWKLCGFCVMKSMQRLAIRSKARKKSHPTAGAPNAKYPNLLDRQFQADRPMQKIAVDICQFYGGGQRYFLAAYLDMFNNEILTWCLGKPEDLSMILPPLRQLLAMKQQDYPLLIHSDQGSQFASYAYTSLLKKHGVIQSMSRAGTPRDNAVMESCFGWFKDLLRFDFDIRNSTNVPATVAQAVEHFNRFRPAFALDYKTPVQFKIAQGV